MWLYVNAKIAYRYTLICGVYVYALSKQTYVHRNRTIDILTK